MKSISICSIISFFFLTTMITSINAFLIVPLQPVQVSRIYLPRNAKYNYVTVMSVTENEDDTKEVEVGSKEYLEGFISSPIQDESVQERGSGLEQGLKLAGSATIILVALFLGFMASNGLL